MSKLQNHLQKETDAFRMTDAEKALMRARLAVAMEMPRTSVPTQSPYAWFFAPRALGLAALALVMIVSSGTAYAAEGSLPGGLLYPVKISVLEPLSVALATSPTAKAEANATIAGKRVEEAQTLAAHGTLTAQTAKEISINSRAHAAAALALAHDVDGGGDLEQVPSAPVVPEDVDHVSLNSGTTESSTTPTIHTFAVGMTVVPTEPATSSPAVLQKKSFGAPTVANISATSTTLSNIRSQSNSTATSTTSNFSSTLRAKFLIQTRTLEELGVQVELRERNERNRYK